MTAPALRITLEETWRAQLERSSAEWQASAGTERLWRKDAALMSGADESRWMAWLDSPQVEAERIGRYRELSRAAAAAGIQHLLVLGMGGSSLGPLVLGELLGSPAGPRLHVLDSTDPDCIARVGFGLAPGYTWVIAASKSGTTLESALLLELFHQRYRAALGDRASEHFIAITDPGSQFEALARERGFRAVVAGVPEIGGRFSVLSPFGLVPAALLGADLDALLAGARQAAELCRRPLVSENPGVSLGLLLALGESAGRCLVRVRCAPTLAPFAGWFEQLLAESTGKGGRGLLPVLGEPFGRPRVDRLALAIVFNESVEGDAPSAELTFTRDAAGLGGAFFLLEVATAVAGARLGVNPFDQPDVEAAKEKTRAITAALERGEGLPDEAPAATGRALRLFLGGAAGARGTTPGDLLRAVLAPLERGGYCALLAYLDPRAELERRLAAVRAALERRGIPTSLGYGPRYLHSTGQLFKGGPAGGVFLLLHDRPRRDLPVPGRNLTFGQVRDAQALGDAAALRERGRTVVRIALEDAQVGLDELLRVLSQAG